MTCYESGGNNSTDRQTNTLLVLFYKQDVLPVPWWRTIASLVLTLVKCVFQSVSELQMRIKITQDFNRNSHFSSFDIYFTVNPVRTENKGLQKKWSNPTTQLKQHTRGQWFLFVDFHWGQWCSPSGFQTQNATVKVYHTAPQETLHRCCSHPAVACPYPPTRLDGVQGSLGSGAACPSSSTLLVHKRRLFYVLSS